MMKKLVLALALTGLVAACDQIVTSAETVETVQSTGTVREIDSANRRMKVLADGQILTLRISDEVKNFDQIDVGDKIRVSYREAVAVQMAAPEAEMAPEGAAVEAVAPEGEKPAYAAAAVQTQVVEFLAYNPSTHDATIRADDGTIAVVEVPRKLRTFAKQRELGDKILLEVEHAVAVVVEPAV